MKVEFSLRCTKIKWKWIELRKTTAQRMDFMLKISKHEKKYKNNKICSKPIKI